MDTNRLTKAASLSVGLLIAFIANKWFEQAWAAPHEFGKWIMLVVAAFFLTIALYQNV